MRPALVALAAALWPASSFAAPNKPAGTSLQLCAGAVCSAFLPSPRAKQLAEAGARSDLSPTVDTAPRTRVNAGETEQFDPQKPWPKARVGSDGTGPCIGMIVWSPDKVTVAHFWAGKDDPEASLSGLSLGSGAKAYLFGGDDSHPSNLLLKGVLAGLKKKGAKVEAYAAFDGLWVDRDGNLTLDPSAKPASSAPGW